MLLTDLPVKPFTFVVLRRISSKTKPFKPKKLLGSFRPLGGRELGMEIRDSTGILLKYAETFVELPVVWANVNAVPG
jgi:hypothetical protein